MVEAYQWYDGKAALDGYLSSIGAGYGGRIILNEEGNPEEQSRDSVMADLPAFLETADAVEVESFFGVQKLILQKAFEKIMGTGTAAERKNSKDKKVIGDLAWWIGKPAGSSEFVSQVEQAAPHLGAEEQKKLGMGENVTGLDVLKYLSDPGFGELGEGGNRPSGIYLGFYNKLDLVSRYVDGKDSERMERIQGSVDPISATINQFNPVTMLATAVQNVQIATQVHGTGAGYMWEAQVLGAYKGMANTLGTAVAAAFSWTGVGIAIGAAIIASGNAIQVDTKTGKRDAVMNDRAAVGTAIGLASMYAGNLTSGANVGAADRLLAAAVNTSASSIGAGFSYNDHGNITGWTLSGSNGDAFWQNMGTGALSAGISEGFIQGFNVNNAYAKDIISSVSSTGVNTFAEYYKYNQGYQNNYAAMANPDIGNASAFWNLAVTMGGRASRDSSATNTTSGDWSWDNAMSGFAEGFLGEFTGWVGLGSALANKTGQVYSMVSGLFGMARRKEEEDGLSASADDIKGGGLGAGWGPDGASERELSARKLIAEGRIIVDDKGYLRDSKGRYVNEYGEENLTVGTLPSKTQAPGISGAQPRTQAEMDRIIYRSINGYSGSDLSAFNAPDTYVINGVTFIKKSNGTDQYYEAIVDGQRITYQMTPKEGVVMSVYEAGNDGIRSQRIPFADITGQFSPDGKVEQWFRSMVRGLVSGEVGQQKNPSLQPVGPGLSSGSLQEPDKEKVRALVIKRAEELGIDPDVAEAVFETESGNKFQINGRVVIRFEPHYWNGTQGKEYGHDAEKIENVELQWFKIEKRWRKGDGDGKAASAGPAFVYTGEHFRQYRRGVMRIDPKSGEKKLTAGPLLGKWDEWRPNNDVAFIRYHGSQAREYQVFEWARQQNEAAAIVSISMGAAQIMGYHAKGMGYGTPEAMFEKYSTDPLEQVEGFFKFVQYRGLVKALQNEDLVEFGYRYNGSKKYGPQNIAPKLKKKRKAKELY
ncbi:N-acetylmuramidase domain-containing protein [Leptonema illini]|nr:N-acetylmuramidase domain-containing protein [Leptonema illini]